MKPEQRIHKAVAEFLRLALVEPAFFTTFPAGGGGKVRGALLKSMGLLPGMPDILVFWPRAKGLGAGGIELKTERGVVSDEQEKCMRRLWAVGAEYAVCRGVAEVEWYLREWRVPLRASVLTAEGRKAASIPLHPPQAI